MSLFISILIGVVIFAYVLRQIIGYVRLGSKAKCKHCGYKKDCNGSACTINKEEVTHSSSAKSK